MDKKRSIGVTIFGILFIIGGFNGILKGISFVRIPSGSFYAGLTELVFAGLSLACGYGVLLLREWGRRLTLFYTILSFLFYIIWWLTFGKEVAAKIMEQRALRGISGPEVSWIPLASILLFFSLLYAGAVVFFFTHPKVKEQFKQA